MKKFSIRFNKTRGMEGRGTVDHVWRLFDGDKEYLFKHLDISVPIKDERDGEDWNICCFGVLLIDRETSTAVIRSEEP